MTYYSDLYVEQIEAEAQAREDQEYVAIDWDQALKDLRWLSSADGFVTEFLDAIANAEPDDH